MKYSKKTSKRETDKLLKKINKLDKDELILLQRLTHSILNNEGYFARNRIVNYLPKKMFLMAGTVQNINFSDVVILNDKITELLEDRGNNIEN